MSTDVVRTHLELSSRDKLRPGREPEVPAHIRRLERVAPADYIALYSRIGEPWHWRDRLAWSDEALRSYLASPNVSVYVAESGSDLVGYFELMRHDDAIIEIMYFGLDRAFIGKRLGGWLLTRAAEQAFAHGAARITLNTCTLDAPQALPNYLARGFVITREETYTVVSPAPLGSPSAGSTGTTGPAATRP